MRIIAYTFEAAMHCPDCTLARFRGETGTQDEHGVALFPIDREHNPVRPVFVTDEISETNCDTCKRSLNGIPVSAKVPA